VSPGGKLWLPEALQWRILKTLHQLYDLGLDNTLVLANKIFGGTKLREPPNKLYRNVKCAKKIPIIKDSRCQGHRDKDPILGKTGS
jgi:hypothetical protein